MGRPAPGCFTPRALRPGRPIAKSLPSIGRAMGAPIFIAVGDAGLGDDVATLADALAGREHSRSWGFRGRALPAACAYRWPARVSALGLACAVVPLPVDRAAADRPAASAALDARTVLARTGSWPEFRANFIEVNGASPPDRAAIFADPGLVSLSARISGVHPPWLPRGVSARLGWPCLQQLAPAPALGLSAGRDRRAGLSLAGRGR